MKKINPIFALIIVALTTLLFSCGSNNANNSSNNNTSSSTYDDTDEFYEVNEEIEDADEPYVCISEDGVVTIESDMYPDGGTSPDYWQRWRFTNKDGKECVVRRSYTPFANEVHSITKDDGSTYYILKCFAKASSVDGYEWLEAYKIVGDTIEEVSVINGGKKIDQDSNPFYVNYCIPSWYFATDGEGYDWMFKYDPQTHNLYIPLVVDGQPSDRYRLWHFDGQRFVDMGEKSHMAMHPSVADYKMLVKYFETKDYIIRVDSLDSGQLRYVSWKKPKTMEDEPNVVINGGIRRSYEVAPDELQPCEDFRFVNNDYEYIVNYCETQMTGEGIGEHHDFLVINKDGKTVLKQPKTTGTWM